jgi:hypothetical protein
MAKMKWDINGKGVDPASGGGQGYNGPNLPKGSWTAKVKRMTVGQIQSTGPNKGKPRISVLLEVTGMKGDKAKYNGHPIWDGLNIIDSSVPFVNGFLHGLTDGSEREKRAIESAFWDEDKGPDFKRVKVEKGNRAGEVDTHIIKIGKVKIGSPNGETLVQVTTREGEWNGKFRAEVTGYIPMSRENTSGDDDDDVDDEDEDDDEDLLEDTDVSGDDDVDDEEDDEDDDEDEDEDDDEDEDEDENDDEPVASGKRPF